MYAINATTLGLSEYQGFNGKLASHGNTIVVEASDGLYELSGDTDNSSGISCYIQTGQLQLGDDYTEKQVDRIWVTDAASDACNIELTKVFWDGEETLGPWPAEPIWTGESHNRVVRGVLGEGGQYWQVKVSNVSGGQFDIGSLVLGVEQTQVVMGG